LSVSWSLPTIISDAHAHRIDEEDHMRSRSIVVFSVLAVATTACGYRAVPVVLQGSPADVRTLAGEWDGRYGGAASGREGSIWMRVSARGDSAIGDVQMLSYTGVALRAAHGPDEHRAHAPTADILQIVFVRVADDRVSGALEPYVAPDCGCEVTTTFTGRITDKGLDGRFVTAGARIGTQSGWWHATRRPGTISTRRESP
jgi:hypothetical protein